MKTKVMLQAELDTQLKRARELSEKAASDVKLTLAEEAEVGALVKSIPALRREIEVAPPGGAFEPDDPQLLALRSGPGDRPDGVGGKSYLALDDRWAAKAAAEIRGALRGPQAFETSTGGTKAIVAGGSVLTPLAYTPDGPAVLPGPVPTLLSALPVVPRQSPTYRYLKQSTRDFQAAVVAAGDTKPTSTMSIASVDAALKVVATLSEALPEYLLADFDGLSTFVQGQLLEAVQLALQDEILNGDGTGEHMLGLAHVSGVLEQTFGEDEITTIAAALSQLEGLGVRPSVVALAAEDWLAVSTTRNSGGGFDLGSAVDAATRKVWGTPVVVVPALDAGEAWAIGENSLQLSTDVQGIRVDIGAPGLLWESNEIKMRVEGRWNLDVMRPGALVKISLSDES